MGINETVIYLSPDDFSAQERTLVEHGALGNLAWVRPDSSMAVARKLAAGLSVMLLSTVKFRSLLK